MYIAMNHFKIMAGKEQDFITIWKNRESHLEEVSGSMSFHLLQGQTLDNVTHFISHSCWQSAHDFKEWTKSQAFAKAHTKAGSKTQDIYLGPPVFEGYHSVLEQSKC